MFLLRNCALTLACFVFAACSGDSGDGATPDATATSLDAAAATADAAPSFDAAPSADAGPSGCFGTPTAAVVETCEALPLGMECSPLSGCTGSGECLPKQSQQDCLLRPLASCGTGSALNNCRVELGDNPPATSLCVQTERAGQCNGGNIVDQGSCLSFDGDSNTQGGVCRWDSDKAPSCVAMDCIGYPIESFCNNVDGCTWQN